MPKRTITPAGAPAALPPTAEKQVLDALLRSLSFLSRKATDPETKLAAASYEIELGARRKRLP